MSFIKYLLINCYLELTFSIYYILNSVCTHLVKKIIDLCEAPIPH